MNTFRKPTAYFSLQELILWSSSVTVVLASFCLFDRENFLTLAASLIGVTSLIFLAKGNPVGQILMVVFSLLYGYISWNFRYYGEMITYVGMTLPMSLFALWSWLRNPFNGNRSEVAVAHLTKKDHFTMWTFTVVVTILFYFILSYCGTANLIPSTLSVTTSFAAVYLTYLRSPWYAVAYACNDVVLILLWALAAGQDISYLSVMFCFVAFLANDIYGFISWRNMERRQTHIMAGRPKDSSV